MIYPFKALKTYLSALMVAAMLLPACKEKPIDNPDGPDNPDTPPEPSSAQVTIGTLLQEMTDRDAVARYPELEYTSASYSSYDRASDSGDWFANGDNNWFIRREAVANREEYVLFEADGPGAITRWWMTFSGAHGGSGYVRVYIDNAKEPAIANTPFQVVSGENITVPPLASSISKLTPVEQRGHNLFYPIPYSTHCKVTYCSNYIRPEGPDGHIGGDECIYYNIEYRTYAPGTTVEPFSGKAVAKYREIEAATANALNTPKASGATSDLSFDCTLAPGESHEIQIAGPAAIREITMQLAAADINQALRSTVLEIAFDGESTVFIPVGEFFGVGYKPLYTKMWYVEATSGGLMTSRWVMPFKSKAALKLTNYGTQQVSVSNTRAGMSGWDFDSRSMYFHAMWKFYQRLDTRTDPVTGATGSQYDLNFVDLEGKGVYMGDSMSLYDISAGWWGEGDEKIYIDGSTFPDIFGTGTEDYYGYAWCHPNTIVDHPFTSQPSGTGNLAAGYTFNSRHRCLDRIAFSSKLVFDMEMWHWNQSTMDLGVSNYFYMLPGGKVLNERDTEGVKAKTVLSSSDFIVLQEDKIDIEAEFLKVEKVTGGIYEAQSNFGEYWSNGVQVFWSQAPTNAEMTLSFESEFEGTYNLKMLYAFSWDYGKASVWFNDTQVEDKRDFYSANLRTGWTEYGPVQVVKGTNRIKVKCVAAHSGINGLFFGLDRIILEK